ncbi:hypothetical protein CYY_004029 [Polysphondylium violaceum]|uniref:Uncharacterized protein n=1 Tax=Polysphondylium violaceum TaxID=133409 RepID=A0A8J4PYV5_9MYCE|nr:hypothetical protein CYY_004029 [Polysphondylium violaceum]
MESYKTEEISIDGVTLKSNQESSISDDLSFDIEFRKLTDCDIKQLLCRIEFVVDIAFNKFTFDLCKSQESDQYKECKTYHCIFDKLGSLESYFTRENINPLFWVSISCLNVYVSYIVQDKEKEIKVSIPTNIYRVYKPHTSTDNDNDSSIKMDESDNSNNNTTTTTTTTTTEQQEEQQPLKKIKIESSDNTITAESTKEGLTAEQEESLDKTIRDQEAEKSTTAETTEPKKPSKKFREKVIVYSMYNPFDYMT